MWKNSGAGTFLIIIGTVARVNLDMLCQDAAFDKYLWINKVIIYLSRTSG
jgi:hypothetical protein